MSSIEYGTQATSAGAAPSTAGDVGAGANRAYSWATNQRYVKVFNSPFSGANLYVRFNDTSTAASTTNWDAILEPGDQVSMGPEIMITQVDVYSDAAVTKGTDFSIRGWK